MTTDFFKVYTHPCHLTRFEGAGNVVHVPYSFKTLHWEQRRLFLCASGTAPRASFVAFGCNERAVTETLCKKRAIKMPVLYKSALVCPCFPGAGTVPNGRSVGRFLVGAVGSQAAAWGCAWCCGRRCWRCCVSLPTATRGPPACPGLQLVMPHTAPSLFLSLSRFTGTVASHSPAATTPKHNGRVGT